PEFLDADAIGLRPAFLTQLEALDQLLGQRAAATFGEECLFRTELDTGLEIRRRLAVLTDTLRTGRDAADPAAVIEQHFGAGKAGIDLDAERLGLFGEPATEIAEANDVIAAVMHLRRRLQAEGAALGQKQKPVIGRRRHQRRAALFPIGEKLLEGSRLEYRTRENMRADLGTL